MKIQVLRMALDTNVYMRGFYARQQFNSENLVRRVILESKDLSDKWASMLNRFEDLALFMGRQARVGENSRRAYEIQSAVRERIKRNIKYLAVYPNMMMLAYFMSDTNATLTIKAWHWTIVIAANTIIEKLFGGELIPWFSFGTDNVPINKTEMIYSFYYALAGGAFETFSVARDAEGKPAVTRKRFFQQVMKKYLSPKLLGLEDLIIAQREAEYGGGIDGVRLACENLKRGNRDFAVTIDSADAVNTTLAGGGGPLLGHGIAGSAQKLYERGKNLRKIREDLRPKLAVVRSMATLLEENMRASGAPQAEVDDTLAEVRGYLARADQDAKSFYDIVYDEHRTFGECLNELTELERGRVYDAIRLEGEHLGAVYDVLAKEDPGALDQAKRAFEFTAGYDDLAPGAYSYTQMDFMLRNARRLQAMKPSTRTQFPPDITRISTWNRVVRLNLRDGQGQVKTREAFVNEGLRNLNGLGQSAFVAWLTVSPQVEARYQRIDAMVELYKAGLELGIPNERRVTADEIVTEALRIKDDAAIRPDELQLMQRLNLRQRTAIESLRRDLLFNSGNGEPLGLLEATFRLVTDNAAARAEAEQFAKSMLTMGTFLFDPGPGIERVMRAQYRPMALNADREETEFDAAILRREAQAAPVEEGRFVYAIDGDGRPMTFESARAPSGGLQLIPPATVRRDYLARIGFFHTDTTGLYFRSLKPGDPECDLPASSKPAGCQETGPAAGSPPIPILAPILDPNVMPAAAAGAAPSEVR